MTFLPIAQRELRAASRRRSTFRVRWWTALLGIGAGAISLTMASLAGGRKAGQILFEILTFYAFALCLLAGGFLTSDALSQERREGTLGLLFLTDLRGYDIVLGKLMATSLNAFYCLLALLPVTAFPLLLGGVTGSEFWRMALALLNTLFFSLAAGMFVSTFMRHSERALLGTLFVVLLFGAVLPLLAGTRMPGQLAQRIHPAWVSPFYAFHYSAGNFYPRQPRAFSSALLVSNLLGWSLLAGASGLVPYISLENTNGLGLTTLFRSRFKRGSRTALRATRSRPALQGKNPVLWLLQAGGENRWMAWAVVAGLGLVVAWGLLATGGTAANRLFASYAAKPFGFALKALIALQACRFFSEGRRDGALELLLCTPLSDREIVRGQIQALWENFRWPFAAFAILLLTPASVRLIQAVSTLNFDAAPEILFSSFGGGVYLVRMVMDSFAVCWVGMALALTIKKPSLASALTILFVLVLPSILSFCLLDILADIVFIIWGSSRMHLDIRQAVAQQYQSNIVVPNRTQPVI